MVHAAIRGCLAQVQHLGLGFHIMLGFVVALWKNNPVKIEVEMSIWWGHGCKLYPFSIIPPLVQVGKDSQLVLH